MLTNGELQKYRHVCTCMPAFTFVCFLTLNTESIEVEMPWNNEFVSRLDLYAPIYKQTNKQTHKKQIPWESN